FARATDPAATAIQSELRLLLDEALSRLPMKYRVPLVLCFLEGKTRARASAELGWSEGTLSSRLSRGKDLLRAYLLRRGVILTAGGLATALAQQVGADTLPAVLAKSAAKVATLHVLGKAGVPGLVAPKVATLAKGVIHAMLMTKLKIATGI